MPTRAKVNPRTSSPTHTLSLSDGSQTYGLILDGGVRAIQESPQTPSTLLINAQGGQFGDFDPSMSHIQQNDWAGGRGSEKFTDDNTRYFDSKNCWTMGDAIVTPSLQWKFVLNTRVQDMYQLGKSYEWRSLAGALAYSHGFTPATSYTTDKVYLWVKKVGNPGALTVKMYSNSSNKPNTALATATFAGTGLNNEGIYCQVISLSVALTAGTLYHLVVRGAATDAAANHWEVMTAYNATATPYTYTSSDLSTWTTSSYKLYFRVASVDVDLKWKFFRFKQAYYAVSIPTTGASKLYSIAEQANAEANSSGIDFKLTEIASAGLSSPVTDVFVTDTFAYFAMGDAVNIRRWTGSVWAADSTNKATFLKGAVDAVDGAIVWRAIISGDIRGVSRSGEKKTGDMSFGTSIKFSGPFDITGMVSYNDALWVFKEDSIWSVRAGKASRLDVGLVNMVNNANGLASAVNGVYLYFGYVTSLEQLYGTTLSDVGPAHGAGIPADRTGSISALLSVMGKLFVAVDGYTANKSSVLVYDGINYHEVWRGHEAGKRIRSLFWKPGIDGAAPYLFIDYGGDIVFVKYPVFGFNLIRDTSLYYVPDAHLITSTIDMNASRLAKIFKEFVLVTKNLSVSNNKAGYGRSALITSNSKISLDYQCDDDIGTGNWTPAGDYLISPVSTVPLNLDNTYAIRLRMRFQTSDAANPPQILATVLEGVARTPIKYQWVIRAKTSSIQSTLNGAPDHLPDKLLKWLQEKASRAEKLTMHSTLTALDNKLVMAEPPSVLREFNDPKLKSWGGTITMVLRET